MPENMSVKKPASVAVEVVPCGYPWDSCTAGLGHRGRPDSGAGTPPTRDPLVTRAPGCPTPSPGWRVVRYLATVVGLDDRAEIITSKATESPEPLT